jgi:Rhodococcus equi virulence-associated protein
VNVTKGKSFNGNAGGVSSPGGGALFGDVYTDNIDNLYANTVSFEFQVTPVYLSILFFDGNSNLLGHFQSGAVSIVTGIGGGTGHWS